MINDINNNEIIIKGNKKLKGTVRISGSKNAVVALIPAACLASGPVTIFDVPKISDVDHLKKILELLNVKTIKKDANFIIDPRVIKNTFLNNEAITKLRASYYFMGVLLGRFKKVKMKIPGGCYLGPRPIDLHLKGFEALGATCKNIDGGYEISAKELIGTNIYLDFASVGATINIILAAVYAKGRTIIENAAKEPEIIDVATMLNKMGATIRGAGTSRISIDGIKYLNGCFHEIIPDRIEAGTYILIAAAMAEKVRIINIIPKHLESLLSKLEEAGVKFDLGIDYIEISMAKELKAISVKTLPYPGFPTDLQSPLGALLTKAKGYSKIVDTIYPQRFKYCEELIKMGAKISVDNGSCVIEGPTKLFSSSIVASDLRCGAALVIAALMSDHETVIKDAYHIYRGYEGIKEKLLALGADIK